MPRVTVNEGGHSMEIFVPASKDKAYDKEIMEYQIEKTREQLRKKPAFKKADPHNKDVAGAIKEKMAFDKRKKAGDIKRFY